MQQASFRREATAEADLASLPLCSMGGEEPEHRCEEGGLADLEGAKANFRLDNNL